jgi:hypothetical protein
LKFTTRAPEFQLTYPDEAKFQFFLPYYIINKEKKGLKFGSEENFTHYYIYKGNFLEPLIEVLSDVLLGRFYSTNLLESKNSFTFKNIFLWPSEFGCSPSSSSFVSNKSSKSMNGKLYSQLIFLITELYFATLSLL